MFNTALTEAPIQREAAPHAFEHRFSFKTSHLTGETNQSSVCIMTFHVFRHVLPSRLIECCLDVQACQIHPWLHHTAMFQHGSSFSLSFPMLFSNNFVIIICKCWQLIPLIPSICNFVQSHPLFFQTQHNTGRVPLCNHRCQRYDSVTSEPLLRFRIWIRQKTPISRSSMSLELP